MKPSVTPEVLSEAAAAPKVLIAGAGISGIHLAISLAELGLHVVLADKAPAMGGLLAQLDHQFPTNHCGMCRMLPMLDRDRSLQTCLRKGLFHNHVEMLSAAQVTAVEGAPGKLTVSLKQQPAGIDPQRCIDCGACEDACPVEAPDAFNAGLTQRKAVYRPVPYHEGHTRCIDWDICTRCGACVEACPVEAVQLMDAPRERRLEDIALVVDARGIGLFDPSHTDLYGAGSYPNVVTALGLERIMSGTGPTRGELVRPSDGRPVTSIAWIQCVGSRNLSIGAEHCSNICCMFALKEAMLVKEKFGADVKATIFYMDLRTFGRDYQRYRDDVEAAGVELVRCRVHSLQPHEGGDDLLLTYVDENGQAVDAVYDMVVLSTGQALQAPVTDDIDWTAHDGVLRMHDTPRLADIADAVITAAATGEQALGRLLQTGSGPLHAGEKTYFDTPRLQQRPVVLLAIVGDALAEMEDRLQGLSPSLRIERVASPMKNQDWDFLKTQLEKGPANRLVLIDARPPLDLRRRLNTLADQTQLPPSWMDVVDLSGELPADEALLLIQSAVQRLQSRRLPDKTAQAMVPSALVVGGGPTGMAAALALAAKSVKVSLVENTDRLGGNADRTTDVDLKARIDQMKTQVEQHTDIQVFLESEVARSFGRPGNFVSRIRKINPDPESGQTEEKGIFHGATILAVGGGAAPLPEDTAIPDNDHIVTLFDLEQLADKPEALGGKVASPSVVMVQCVGSREEPRNYCSRICCQKAVKTALKIKADYPNAAVTIFYRDMMTYGESERLYTEARKQGVRFIPFDLKNKPVIAVKDGKPSVDAVDPVLGESVHLEPDWIALATGLVPTMSIKPLGRHFSLSTTVDGFLKEADVKWRPVDTLRNGIFVCGLARAPMGADDAMAEGRAAAFRALGFLWRSALQPSAVTPRVRPALCSRCQVCITACPYEARYVDPEDGSIAVDAAACQGCGTCAAVCPNSATLLCGLEEDGLMATLENVL